VANAYAAMARWLVFAVTPWAALFVGILVWWVSFYYLAPVFFPLTAYGGAGGQSILSVERLGWPINIAYSSVVAALATWLGRTFSLPKAIAIYVATLLGTCIAVHGLMLSLGHRYWYDTP
jgi:hypothetical protein